MFAGARIASFKGLLQGTSGEIRLERLVLEWMVV